MKKLEKKIDGSFIESTCLNTNFNVLSLPVDIPFC